MTYRNRIAQHYADAWSQDYSVRRWLDGPVDQLPGDFCILEFARRTTRDMWTYATCCMSQPSDERRLELHLFSPRADETLVELLTAIAHYHRTGESLWLGHSVNLGRPWLPHSSCDHGLISLPYLDGPALEVLTLPGRGNARFLWLIPVTKAEVQFKGSQGLEALEQAFERSRVNYLDPVRESVV